MPKISCFLPFIDEAEGLQTIHSLQNLDEVSDIHLIGNQCQTSSLRQMADEAQSPYILLYTKRFDLQLGYYALTRMLTVAEDSNASMLYADHRIQLPDGTVEAQLINRAEHVIIPAGAKEYQIAFCTGTSYHVHGRLRWYVGPRFSKCSVNIQKNYLLDHVIPPILIPIIAPGPTIACRQICKRFHTYYIVLKHNAIVQIYQ